MSVKLLKFIVTLIYLIEATGVSCLASAVYFAENALRPMASAVSHDAATSSIPHKGSSGGDSTKDYDCSVRSFDVIFEEYSIRNRKYLLSDEAARKMWVERLKYVIENTSAIPDFLLAKFKDRKIISVIVLGDYLWYERAADMELLIITEGEDELGMFARDFIPIDKLLKDKKVTSTGIRCIAATIGYDRLKELSTREVLGYAIRGWREGVAIFGIDPYKSKELSSCTEKIQHLDFLLDSSEISLKELENSIAKSHYDERAARIASLHKDRIEKRTTEAMSVLKEIAGRYSMKEIIRSLEVTERKYKHQKFRKLKDYYKEARKIYERFMKELKVKPRSPKDKGPAARAEAELPAKYGEPSRAERLNLILKENPKLDTAEKLLEYIKKKEPHLLDAISREKQLEFLGDFMFLGYETVPLPESLLKRLPRIKKAGERIAAIGEARKMKPEEIYARTGIALSTYSQLKQKKEISRPGRLIDISREFKIDPIFIIRGKAWDDVSADLQDPEKMRLCRLRKGWTQKQCAIALEKAGLKFNTDSIVSKMQWVLKCENGEKIPSPKERKIIRKVFGESTLYKEADEAEGALPEGAGFVVEPSVKGGPKYLRGVPKARIHIFLAKYWQQVAGLTPSRIERKYDIPAASIRVFLQKNKGAAKIYNIDFTEKKAKPSVRGRPPTEEEPFFPPSTGGQELSRPERLNLILKENPKLNTAEKLLEYIKKKEPHLLDAISEEKQLEFLRDFMFLGYETIPLPKKVLKQLPGMTTNGARLDAIRKARGMEKKELYKLAEINSSVYANMVKKKDFRQPKYVFKVLGALKADAIYIKKGKAWDEVAPDLEDKDKMFLCRFRKGWTQRDFIIKLEEAGLEFGTDKMRSKEILVTKWEKEGKIPKPEKRGFIRKVLGESAIYEKADEGEQAEPKEKAAEETKEATKAEGPKEERLRLPGDKRTSDLPQLFAEHREQINGMTIKEIAVLLNKSHSTIRNFLWDNPSYVESYGVAKREKGRPVSLRAGAEKPKITMAETAEKAAEEIEVGEAGKAGESEEARIITARGEIVRRIRLKAAAVDPEVEVVIFEAGEIYERLRSPEDRTFVEAQDIEDAISELRDICNGLEKESESGKRSDIREVRMEIRRRLIEARVLLRRLQVLVSTELCDWDNPEIRQKADEITKGRADDSERVKAIKKWVKDNIKLVPEYDECWKTRASRTLQLLKGTYFNRANLIVGMLRSIGIPAHYRIMTVKKEAVKDMVGPKIYAGMGETIEYIVPKALILEEFEVELTGKTRKKYTEYTRYKKYKWITLEHIEAEKIIESYMVDNIDEFARKKAREYKRKPRTGIRGQGEGRGRANPSQRLKALMAISQSA